MGDDVRQVARETVRGRKRIEELCLCVRGGGQKFEHGRDSADMSAHARDTTAHTEHLRHTHATHTHDTLANTSQHENARYAHIRRRQHVLRHGYVAVRSQGLAGASPPPPPLPFPPCLRVYWTVDARRAVTCAARCRLLCMVWCRVVFMSQNALKSAWNARRTPLLIDMTWEDREVPFLSHLGVFSLAPSP